MTDQAERPMHGNWRQGPALCTCLEHDPLRRYNERPCYRTYQDCQGEYDADDSQRYQQGEAFRKRALDLWPNVERYWFSHGVYRRGAPYDYYVGWQWKDPVTSRIFYARYTIEPAWDVLRVYQALEREFMAADKNRGNYGCYVNVTPEAAIQPLQL